jgi:hypothetical protein
MGFIFEGGVATSGRFHLNGNLHTSNAQAPWYYAAIILLSASDEAGCASGAAAANPQSSWRSQPTVRGLCHPVY